MGLFRCKNVCIFTSEFFAILKQNYFQKRPATEYSGWAIL
jgi:hypothetical protein